jgi:TonB family protein
VLRPYYRNFELPWSADWESEESFRKLWIALLVACLVLGFLIWLIDVPDRDAQVAPSIPPRLAKIVIEREMPPPPPPPEPEVVEPEKPKPTEDTKPREKPPEIDRTQRARERASKAGLLAMEDQFKDIREQFELTKEQLEAVQNTTGAIEGPMRSERSLITSKVGAASGGISMAGQSRGFGSGAGNLGGVSTTQMVVPFGSGAGRGANVNRTGASGKPRRSPEEIELEFDRNKGAIYALYSRALRENPALQGKMVLEFTISPAGEVTMCRIVSSELNDPELERKIIARVRLIRFQAKEVEAITTTKPIEFFPA